MRLFTAGFLIALLTGLLFLATPGALANSGQLTESEAKASFVFNVARYVTWPKSAFSSEDTLEIGILGNGASGSAWDGLKGKTVQGRKLVVRKSRDLDDLRSCQVIYIEDSERRSLPRILRVLRHEPVLTISAMDEFIRSEGGMVNLKIVNNRLTLAVNLGNARASGLDISSYLLKLAVEVLQ
jgi:hypothetical protein